MGRRETVTFNGREYARYPDSRSKSARRYFYSRGGKWADQTALHRDVWEDANGPIPDGWHVHHIDGDTGNNDLANLVALPPSDHALEHEPEYSEEFKAARAADLDRAQRAARAWHRSPEGRRVHSRIGARSWDSRSPEIRTCVECGKEYENLAHRESDRFCSRQCISRHNERTRRYYEDRNCVVCGTAFNVKKSKPQTVCSRHCSWVVRKGKASAGIQSDG